MRKGSYQQQTSTPMIPSPTPKNPELKICRQPLKPFDEIWASVKESLEVILKKEAKLEYVSFTETYHNVFALVQNRYGEQLYSSVTEVIKDHVITRVRELVLSSLNKNFLKTLTRAWNDYRHSIDLISSILQYLTRIYTRPRQLDDVDILGLIIFRDEVIRHARIRNHLYKTLIDMVMEERRNNTIVYRSAIKRISYILKCLGRITPGKTDYEDFEEIYLAQSREFYRVKSQKFLAENSISKYIHEVEKYLSAESIRAKEYLNEETEKKIVETVECELIEKHVKTIVEDKKFGLIYMLENEKRDDIECMHRLLSRVCDGLGTMFKCTSEYLHKRGQSIGEGVDVYDASSFIQNLFAKKPKLQESD